MGIRIAATGRYMPPKVVTNDDLSKMMETSDEWISSRTGIHSRRVVQGEPTSYMASEAARAALSCFEGSVLDIGMIVCSTVTPDFHTPSVSCLVQAAIGAENAFCIDISCACTGFVQALDIAQKYLAAGVVRSALVVSAETLSHIADYEDRATCVLFGDGAGACIVTADEGRYTSFFGADGKGGSALYASQFYPHTPFEDDEGRARYRAFPHEEDGFLHMDGKEVYKFSTIAMPLCIEKACACMGVTPGELSLIIPHQANIRIVKTAMKHLELPFEKAYMNIDKCGNTSSATIPIALDEAVRSGVLKAGDLLAVVGFGAGLTFGAAVFDWH